MKELQFRIGLKCEAANRSVETKRVAHDTKDDLCKIIRPVERTREQAAQETTRATHIIHLKMLLFSTSNSRAVDMSHLGYPLNPFEIEMNLFSRAQTTCIGEVLNKTKVSLSSSTLIYNQSTA